MNGKPSCFNPVVTLPSAKTDWDSMISVSVIKSSNGIRLQYPEKNYNAMAEKYTVYQFKYNVHMCHYVFDWPYTSSKICALTPQGSITTIYRNVFVHLVYSYNRTSNSLALWETVLYCFCMCISWLPLVQFWTSF